MAWDYEIRGHCDRCLGLALGPSTRALVLSETLVGMPSGGIRRIRNRPAKRRETVVHQELAAPRERNAPNSEQMVSLYPETSVARSTSAQGLNVIPTVPFPQVQRV